MLVIVIVITALLFLLISITAMSLTALYLIRHAKGTWHEGVSVAGISASNIEGLPGWQLLAKLAVTGQPDRGQTCSRGN